MKKYLFLSILFLLPMTSYSMEKQAVDQGKEQATVQADDECMVCLGEAKELLEEKGPGVIRRTDCCKKLLCADCEKDLAKSNITSCPNCRREGLTTSPAVIAAQEAQQQQPQQNIKNQAQEMLRSAILNNSEKDLKQAIQDGADVNLMGKDGKTPIWLAILAGRYSLVILLIESGATIDQVYKGDSFAQIALNRAVDTGGGDPNIIKILSLLIANNIDFSNIVSNSRNLQHYILSWIANDSKGGGSQRRNSLIELIQEYATHNHNFMQEIWNKMLSVHLYRNKQLIEVFIKHGIDINKNVGQQNIPPIFFAVNADDAGALEVLLNAGADINVQVNPDGKGIETPLSWALENAKSRSIKFLLNRGAKTPSEL